MKKRKVCNELCLAMSKPAKGAEFCKLLLSKASKNMQKSLFLMLFPLFLVSLAHTFDALRAEIVQNEIQNDSKCFKMIL